MKLTCPTCGRSYALSDEAIGGEGRDVRCSRCNTIWRARRERAPSLAAAGDDGGIGDDLPAAGLADTVDEDLRSDDGGFTLDQGDRASFPNPDLEFADLSAFFDDDSGKRTIDADNDEPAPVDPFARTDVEAAAHHHHIKVRERSKFEEERTRAERISEIGGPIMLAVAVLVVFAGIMLRKPIVEGVPDLAGVYELIGLKVNVRGLTIENVTSTRDFAGGDQILVVEGDVRNVSDAPKTVPLVRLTLLSERGDEIYTWSISPSATELEAGDSVHFRSRLASPPELGKRLQVRFMDREIQKPLSDVRDGNPTGGTVDLDGMRGQTSPTTGTRE